MATVEHVMAKSLLDQYNNNGLIALTAHVHVQKIPLGLYMWKIPVGLHMWEYLMGLADVGTWRLFVGCLLPDL